MQKSKYKRFFKLGLLTLSTALTLMAVEIFLHLFYPTPYYGYAHIPPQQQLFQYDAVLGWKGRPDARGIFAGRDFCVYVTQDCYGYRNVTRPFVDDKENIVVLGDSLAWGWGVEDDEVFSALITNKTSHINVYNLSAPGYGTDQEYLTLNGFLEEYNGLNFSGAILLFCFNDFEDVLSTVRYSYPKPRFVLYNNDLLLENIPVPELKKEEYNTAYRDQIRLKKGILRYFHIYNLTWKTGSSLLKRIKRKLSRNGALHELPVKSPIPENSQYIICNLLKEIDALCKRHGMFFHIVLMITTNTDREWHREIERLAAYLSTANIKFSYFHSRVFPSTELWMDRHLSKYGHKVLASHILKIIKEK